MFDEITNPSPHVFPRDLLKAATRHKRKRGNKTSFSADRSYVNIQNLRGLSEFNLDAYVKKVQTEQGLDDDDNMLQDMNGQDGAEDEEDNLDDDDDDGGDYGQDYEDHDEDDNDAAVYGDDSEFVL